MERNDSSLDESLNIGNNNFNSPTSDKNPFSKRSNLNTIYDDIDIDKYLPLVEAELKKWNYSLDNRAYVDVIVGILDKLVEPQKFNKTIFFHILDYADINRDSPILLLDFFRSFFTVYESMKRNRELFALQMNRNTEKIEVLKNAVKMNQNREVILENGLTNNSVVKIKNLTNLPLDNPNLDHKFVFKFGEFTKSLLLQSPEKKVTFSVNSLDILEQPVRLFLEQNGSQIYIDKVNVRDTLDTHSLIEFSHNGVSYKLNLIWINSKVNHYNKKITQLEQNIDDLKENINVLNNCIIHIEGNNLVYLN